jgi:hypothetical protein
MRAKIIQYSPSSTQNAPFANKFWKIEFESDPSAFYIDKLTGWLSTNDTNYEIRIAFPDRESAESFAKEKGIEYEIIQAKEKKPLKITYADNFK